MKLSSVVAAVKCDRISRFGLLLEKPKLSIFQG